MKNIPFDAVKTGGFLGGRIETNRVSTIPNIYLRFKETGRFAALGCRYEEGMPRPHIFWDSDVAKWIESVAYSVSLTPDKETESLADELIDAIAASQLDDGYFNSYYIACEPENRFTNRDNHELYCLGHLTEAAVAYYKATGKDKLLGVVEKYIDLVEKIFVTQDSAAFSTPGHEEIELALIKLYELTGNEKYKNLCAHFIDTRGTSEKDLGTRSWTDESYDQSHLPVRQQKKATGHSVRALYLFSGMADLARHTGDKELTDACKALFDNIYNKRMYITGGVGSAAHGEAFTADYDLPNDTAYSESCASIALAFFGSRMLHLDMNSKYADAVEKAFYNCVLAGVSLDGKSFFYVNPLEINTGRFNNNKKYRNSRENLLTQRVEVFDCSCCPPNISRIIPSFPGCFYTYDDSTLYVHHFGESEAEYDGMKISQVTRYPHYGTVRITVSGLNGRRLAVRIPGWCSFVTLNGEKLPSEPVNGYVYLDARDGQVFDFYFDMKPRLVCANPEVDGDNGRVCVMKGPLVYCAESVLNGGVKLEKISIDSKTEFGAQPDEKAGALRLYVTAYEDLPSGRLYYDYDPGAVKKRELALLPYYAFANNGESDMQVWMRVK